MEQNKKQWSREIGSLIMVVFIALLIRTLIFEPFFIPSSSMEATLLDGDYIFATKYDYGYSKHSIPIFSPDILEGRAFAHDPKPGDIIIFRPPHRMDIRYIKRLIGVPGDKIQMIKGDLYVNDQKVEKDYIGEYTDIDGLKFKQYKETLANGVSYNVLYLDNSFNQDSHVFNVPEGEYFFMGDNRDQSLDSRFDLGYVPFENIIAKAKMIFFSTEHRVWVENQGLVDRFKQVGKWISSIRFHRMLRSVDN
jgi:signal peptidase I